MEGRLLIKNCTVLERGVLRRGCAVVVEGPAVVRVAADSSEPVRPGDWAVDAQDRLLLPGRVDGHAELAGADGSGRKRSTSEVEALAAAAIAQALRGGTTTLLNQLSEAQNPLEALGAQARAARRLGVRLVTGLAADGMHAVAEHDLNVEFARAHGEDPLVRGALGFATCLGASDELLTAVSRAAESLRAPVQFRLAETDSELVQHFEQHRMRMVERLAHHGLLTPSAVPGASMAPRRSCWPSAGWWWPGARWPICWEINTVSTPCGSRSSAWRWPPLEWARWRNSGPQPGS
jgi:cytosine/adenosine deaminase-related metal-dependent hydrolase